MLSDRVRECLHHGDECMRQAAAQTDPKLRRDYLIIGRSMLAETHPRAGTTGPAVHRAS
jgi:hypothetical protein